MSEGRDAPRHRVLKAGTIESGGGAIDCTVRKLSNTGAALDAPKRNGSSTGARCAIPSFAEQDVA
jgi:hypothetical protein